MYQMLEIKIAWQEMLAVIFILYTLTAASTDAAETLPEGFPTRKGVLAFFPANILANPEKYASDLAWLSNFDILLTNGEGLASPATRRALQTRGCKLFRYFWTNGFYQYELDMKLSDGDWRNNLVMNHRDWLLSRKPLPSVAGKPAHYFDIANRELAAYLCEQLKSFRLQSGYDGVFFDYAGVYGLPKEAEELWNRAHPDLPYDRALAGMFRKLREMDPQTLIFTNQAHLSQEPLLGEVDHDLSESNATSWCWGPEVETKDGKISETYFRPWKGGFGIDATYRAHDERIRLAPPRGRLLYLDYMRPRYRRAEDGKLTAELDVEAVYYSYCAAALWGRASFCSGWYAGREYRGPLYFADLGKPLGEGPEELDGLAVREYQRGLVALMTSKATADVDYKLKAPTTPVLYDLFASQWLQVHGRQVKLRLTPSRSDISGVARPVGRVYLKSEPKTRGKIDSKEDTKNERR